MSDRRGVTRIATMWAFALPVLVVGLALVHIPWLAAVFLVALLPVLRVCGSLGLMLGAEHAPLGAGLAAGYGLALAAWSCGALAGPVVAGWVADRAGDGTALILVAAAAAVALPVIGAARPRRPTEGVCG